MNKLILILFLAISFVGCKRKGCTSYEAVNFDWRADVDDGSCLFWAGWQSDFDPPSGADLSQTDTTSPAHYRLMVARPDEFWEMDATGQVITNQGAEHDVVSHNDSLFIYYHAWQAGTETDRICLAVTENEGTKWVYKYVSLQGYGSGELSNMHHPDVIYYDDQFVMHITAQHEGQWSILRFVSPEGLNFQYDGVAVHEAGKDHIDSHTYDYGDSYYMITKNGTDSLHSIFSGDDEFNFSSLSTLTFVKGTDAQYVSNTYQDGYLELYTYSKTDSSIYRFSSSDGTLFSQVSGTYLEFGGSSGESIHLKDAAVARDSRYEPYMVYSTRIP